MLLLGTLWIAQTGQSLLGGIVPHPTGQNGYEEYLQAADLLRSPEAEVYARWSPGASPTADPKLDAAKVQRIGDLQAHLSGMTPLDVRREELSRFGRALDLIRAGNAKDAFDPRPSPGPDTLFPEYVSFKNLAHFAVRASSVYAADGKTDRAAEVLLDELEYSDAIGHGLLIGYLVGAADTSIALAAFSDLLPRLSRADAVHVQRAVEMLLARPTAVRAALATELAFAKASLRQGFAANDGKGLFVDSDATEPDPKAKTMTRELEAMSRTERTELLRQIEMRLDDRALAMDRVLAGPESGWTAGIAALDDDEEEIDDLQTYLVALTTPSYGAAVSIALRERTQLRLLDLHARLAQYRWDTGRYPETIDVPDPLTGGKYLYERREDGTIRLASKGIASTGEIELKYKRTLPVDEPGGKP